MADMTALTDIVAGNAGTATPVQANFQTIETYINGSELLRSDGSEVMTADLDLDGNRMANLADGAANDDIVTVGQLNALLPYLVYHGSGSQSVATGLADLTVDTETYDIGSVGSVGSAVLTIPATGLYHVIFQGLSSTSLMTLFLAGTAPVTSFGDVFVAAPDGEVQGSGFAYAQAADTFTIRSNNFGATSTMTFDVKLYRLV